MSAESTRTILDSYAQALLSFGDYARYLTEDVMLTIEGTDRSVSGREPVRQMIAFMHTQAFKTNVQVKRVVYGDGHAMLEAEFVGTHVGTFEGIPATHREVRVPYAVAYDVNAAGITALRLYFPMDALIRQIGAAAEEKVAAAV